MAASCILFVLYGPLPVKRKVTIVPRHTNDVFDSSPRYMVKPSQIATATEPAFQPRGASPAPLPRGRSARGTTGPRSRPSEEIQTDRVPRVDAETGSFIVDGH